MDLYWTTKDLHAGRCSVDQLGQTKPLVEILDPAVVIDNTPEAMTRVGIGTLMRLAQQTRDLPTALKAALALLDRSLGKVMPPQAPAMPPEPTADLPAPPWMDPNQRLAYQDPAYAPPPCSQERETLPEPVHPTSPEPEAPTEPPMRPLHLVPAPQFWDSPSRPSHSDPFSSRS